MRTHAPIFMWSALSRNENLFYGLVNNFLSGTPGLAHYWVYLSSEINKVVSHRFPGPHSHMDNRMTCQKSKPLYEIG